MYNLERRLITAILLPLALGGVLAGCGGDDDQAAGENTPATAAKPAGKATEIDQAFVRQMVPHHQMAVEMAEMAKADGEHAEVKKLADEIIASQNAEIDKLTEIGRDLGVSPDGAMGGAMMAADAKALGLTMDAMGMSMDMNALTVADPFDQAFIVGMIPHHEGAIAMAKAQLERGSKAELKKISTAIIAAQEKEIMTMAGWHEDWYGGAPAPAPSDPQAHSGH